MIARVAVFAPVERTFDYRVPPSLRLAAGPRALLGAIAGGTHKGEPAPKPLRALVERDLVTVEEAVSTRGVRVETIVRVATTPPADAFARAKKRGETWARIVVAGEVALSV